MSFEFCWHTCIPHSLLEESPRVFHLHCRHSLSHGEMCTSWNNLESLSLSILLTKPCNRTSGEFIFCLVEIIQFILIAYAATLCCLPRMNIIKDREVVRFARDVGIKSSTAGSAGGQVWGWQVSFDPIYFYWNGVSWWCHIDTKVKAIQLLETNNYIFGTAKERIRFPDGWYSVDTHHFTV